MKTPEEIKKGLELCSNGDMRECLKCPYPIGFECFESPMKDALAYIQQLESRLAQVERERDAAVADLTESSDCSFCEYKDNNREFGCGSCIGCEKECPCAWCSKGLNGFKWRGVCPENTKEEEK